MPPAYLLVLLSACSASKHPLPLRTDHPRRGCLCCLTNGGERTLPWSKQGTMKTLYFNSRVEWEDYMRISGVACNGTSDPAAANTDSSNCLCWNCSQCTHCTECIDCSQCSDCLRCIECSDCIDCWRCSLCLRCTQCSDCTDCSLCTACTDCSLCDLCWFVQQKSLGLTARGAYMPDVQLVYDCTNSCEVAFVGSF